MSKQYKLAFKRKP